MNKLDLNSSISQFMLSSYLFPIEWSKWQPYLSQQIVKTPKQTKFKAKTEPNDFDPKIICHQNPFEPTHHSKTQSQIQPKTISPLRAQQKMDRAQRISATSCTNGRYRLHPPYPITQQAHCPCPLDGLARSCLCLFGFYSHSRVGYTYLEYHVERLCEFRHAEKGAPKLH